MLFLQIAGVIATILILFHMATFFMEDVYDDGRKRNIRKLDKDKENCKNDRSTKYDRNRDRGSD